MEQYLLCHAQWQTKLKNVCVVRPLETIPGIRGEEDKGE
jgi:hypothetical protein